MNVTELARKLKIPTRQLLEILPAVGFGIGQRAIKIDNRQAEQIIRQWPQLLAKYHQLQNQDKAEEAEEVIVKEKKPISIPSFIRVKDFSQKLGLPLPKVMAELMKSGIFSSMNEEIDFDTAAIIGADLGFEIVADTAGSIKKEQTTVQRLENLLAQRDQTKLKPRPPVVVVMGHVDHGKTKLLDTIRKTNVIAQESGGITQHIGAYQVKVPFKESSSRRRGLREETPYVVQNNNMAGRAITFIDTPGHEAFTTMRSRGARVADVAVLVVAADDGVQPQTKESIKIINSAGLPMIVAINKIDKPDANPEKIKQELAGLNLTPEEWGGKTICLPVSAKEGTGIADLLEMILLVSETQKERLSAAFDGLAFGTVVESHIDRGEGPVATLLVQEGTLKIGDLITVADTFYGKVRAMKDFLGQPLQEAEPSTPVKILGLKATPSIGDIFEVRSKVARELKIKRHQLKEKSLAYAKPVEIAKEDVGNLQSLNLVLKADVLGSLEAIIASLIKLEHPEVAISIIAKGLGNITEGDVRQAEAAEALILGFHVQLTPAAESYAREKNIEIKIYDIIYQLIDEAKSRLEKMLTPEVIRTFLGRLKVLAIFRREKNWMVIGGKVTKGKLAAGTKIDVLREKNKIATGSIDQLQINKIDVTEVVEGQECGIKYQGKPVIGEGDILEVYTEEIKQKKLG